MNCIEEYHYRKVFGLSKAEMAEEPLEDVAINFKIIDLLAKKEKRENAIMKQKQQHGIQT